MNKLLILIVLISFTYVSSCTLGKQRVDQPEFEDPLRGQFISIDAILEASDSAWTGTIDSCFVNIPDKPIFILVHDYCSGVSCPVIFFYRKTNSNQYKWVYSFSDQLTTTDSLSRPLIRRVDKLNQSIMVTNVSNEIVKKYSIEWLISKLYH